MSGLYRTYQRIDLNTGRRDRVEFSTADYQQFDLAAGQGLTAFQALQLVNRWNAAECATPPFSAPPEPEHVYYLEPA
jgi:hypothetical protein